MKPFHYILSGIVLLSIGYFAVQTYQQQRSPNTVIQTPSTLTTTSMPIPSLKIDAINHASFVLNWGETTIFADPVGDAALYANASEPELILITHEHGDHFNTTTIEAKVTPDTVIVVPQSIAGKLPESLKKHLVILKNGESTVFKDITIQAVPAYNLREEDKNKHPQSRDNGYVLEKDGKRVYIAGDTEDIPEMRALKNIDIAFIPMNLPYTMNVEKAANAVLAFKPKHVYPYHYRTPTGFSDVANFKQLVNAGDAEIDVVQLDWYK